MTEDEAIELAKQYSSKLGIRVTDTTSVEFECTGWWIFRSIDWISIALATDSGTVDVTIWDRERIIHSFLLTPVDSSGELLPLWLAFPDSNSVTSMWRQGTGETYKYLWHDWWSTLTQDKKTDYRKRYPEPLDEELCWSGFYEEIAEVPGDSDSIGDLIIGRVPH